MSKLPKEVHISMEKNKSPTIPWSVALVRQKLLDEISAREAVDRYLALTVPKKSAPQSNTAVNSNYRYRNEKHRPATGEALFASEQKFSSRRSGPNQNDKRKCIFCSGNHWSDECRKYSTVNDRKGQIRNLCYICLSQNHRMHECNVKTTCPHCQRSGKHHRSLCIMKFPFTHATESAAVAHETTDDTAKDDAKNNAKIDAKETENAMLATGEKVLLQTAKCTVYNPKTAAKESTRLLMDCGSNRSYITESLAKQLSLKTVVGDSVTINRFATQKTVTVSTKSTQVDLSLKNGGKFRITVSVIPKITGTMHRAPLNINKSDFLWKDLPLADNIPTNVEKTQIQLLIGNDFYADLVTGERMQVREGLFLLGSKFGWMLSGRIPDICGPNSHNCDSALLILSQTRSYSPDVVLSSLNRIDDCANNKPDMRDLWELETIGIKDSPEVSDDDLAQQTFDRSVKFEEDRYQVVWPWKRDPTDLPENFQLAFGRLKSLIRRTEQVPDLMLKCQQVIDDQIKKGIIEPVTENTVVGSNMHYIPHHAVITPLKTTTKVRIVYDASAKTRKENYSLNECLFRGPVYLESLCGLLLRFRTYKIVLLSDIEKAFLQVGLQPEARDVTRFLWLKDSSLSKVPGNVQIYRFCRVPFGVISSPFLLGATIAHHLHKYDSTVANEIGRNLYVDNVMLGVSDLKSALSTYSEAKQIFRECSMNLREWVSNSAEFCRSLPHDDRVKETNSKVLGLMWNVSKDTFSIPVSKFPDEKCTKRTVLKFIAQIYDPLGLFLPVTMLGKMFLQKLWNENLEWDTLVSETLAQEWNNVGQSLQAISAHQMNRFVGVNKERSYSLLAFCDASQKCYATVIYLWDEISLTAHLLFAKGRVKPMRNISLPRLELLAVLIGVRALKFVKTEIRLHITSSILWTDSQCVLYWLRSRKQLSTFVANRVKEINTESYIQFRYVQTDQNPADLPLRGKQLHSLSPLWWEGPCWLKSSKVDWPEGNMPKPKSDTLEFISAEMKGTPLHEASLPILESIVSPFGIVESHYSSFVKLIRITACCQKFIRMIRKNSISSAISAEDFNEAKDMWVRYVQHTDLKSVKDSIKQGKPDPIVRNLNVWIDNSDILRCSGRLDNAEDLQFDTKHPKLLPQRSYLTKLIVKFTHGNLCHTGVSQTLSEVRNEFWIPCGRTVVKSVIRNCLICKRHEGGPYTLPKMPSLPKSRVSEYPAFSFVGLDYLGPLYVKTVAGDEKVWICLFTCLTVRAIHLEIVRGLNAEQFLLCLRRFIARRGKPVQIISDNAAQFKLTKTAIGELWNSCVQNSDVVDFSANNGIRWKFIPELAPWSGGFYERMVGVVKRSLRKCLGRLRFYFDQLQTLTYEIEAVINSRPLIYVTEDQFPNELITPSHFLSVNRNTGNPNIPISSDPDYIPQVSNKTNLIQFWKRGIAHLDAFWKIWHREYLLSLRERLSYSHQHPRISASSQPKVGQVVLIKEQFTPRGKWKLGRIKKFFTAGDEATRAVSVQLPNGKHLNRPVNLLFPLECEENNQVSSMSVTERIPDEGVIVDPILPEPPDLQQTDQKRSRQAAKLALERIAKLAELYPEQ